MPKLTDEELGQLLRETFTEKEDLVDQLPEATLRPVVRRAPALLAAAAVLTILGGGISIAGAGLGSSPSESAKGPAASSTPSKVMAGSPAEVGLNVKLSGLAVAELTKWERPAGGWPVVNVLDGSYLDASSPTVEGGGVGTPFSKQEKAAIAAVSGVPIAWVKHRPVRADACDLSSGVPYVTIGQVVVNQADASSATIGMSIWRGCLDAQWLTYRLESAARHPVSSTGGSGTEVLSQSGQVWIVAGTVGPVAVS